MYRTIDIELGALSTLFSWAARHGKSTGIQFNPLLGRKRFVDTSTVRHCTAVMPMSDEVFHRYASYLLASEKSRALGWQFLLEALTMCRTCEILACRMDARELSQDGATAEAGFQNEDYFFPVRAKRGQSNGFPLEMVPGHDPLRECLAAFRHWHRQRYPHSPWFIPGRDPKQPMRKDSLTHALRRAGKALGLPKVTSHGLIAYGVRVHRAMGVDDSEISKRRGLRTGVALIEKVYGTIQSGWFGSRRLDYLPDGLPAWAKWLPSSYQKVTRPDTKTSHRGTQEAGIELAGKWRKHWRN